MILRCCVLLVLANHASAVDSDTESSMPDSTIQPTDHQRILGRWRVKSMGLRGRGVPVGLQQLEIEFKQDKVRFFEGGKHEIATLKLDPTKSPAHIDLEDTTGRQKIAGVYEISGDRLRMVWAQTGNKRPTTLKPDKDVDLIVFVLERIKK